MTYVNYNPITISNHVHNLSLKYNSSIINTVVQKIQKIKIPPIHNSDRVRNRNHGAPRRSITQVRCPPRYRKPITARVLQGDRRSRIRYVTRPYIYCTRARALPVVVVSPVAHIFARALKEPSVVGHSREQDGCDVLW